MRKMTPQYIEQVVDRVVGALRTKSAVVNRARIFQTLAEPTRLEIISLVASEPEGLTIGEIVVRLRRSEGVIISHLTILRTAGLVDKKTEGRYRRVTLKQEIFQSLFGPK